MARYEFTMVSDPMMRGLIEAGATGNEVAAYVVLIRGLPSDRKTSDCWMPADMAEKKLGMRADVFTRSLRSLTKKCIVLADGREVPVLTKMTRGCYGHCPHYEDNLGRLIAEGLYPRDGAKLQGKADTQQQG